MDQTSVEHATKRALVVEGGGMRGIFSAGVLDGFMDRRYRPFDVCLGVSAGSTNLAAWLAHQQGRNHKVITDYSCRPQFISFKRFLRGGHWLDLDWLWDITIREIRLDLATFAKQPIPLYVVTTKVADGQAAYIKATPENLEQLLKASCSVPIVYRQFTMIDGEPMTDGGVADSIPVIQAHRMGARDITVILSRPNGYRKRRPRSAWLLRRLLSKTPHLADAMISRAAQYNRSIDFIENPPPECRIRVIAPPPGFAVGRTTTDFAKLREGYHMGLEAARSLSQYATATPRSDFEIADGKPTRGGPR